MIMRHHPLLPLRQPTGTSLLTAMIIVTATAWAQDVTPLPGTKPLTTQGDLSAQMVEGIDRFLLQEIGKSVADRTQYWRR